MATPPRVKYLFEICSTCGNEVVNDNVGTGRPWKHLATPDDHHITFGRLVDREALMASLAWPRPADVDTDEAEAEACKMSNHSPQIPARDVTLEELGTRRTARRQVFELATEQGFTIEGKFSRGPVADQWGRFDRQADSILIAGFHPDDSRLFVVWWMADLHGEFKLQTAKCAGLVGIQSVDTLKKYLRGEPVQA